MKPSSSVAQRSGSPQSSYPIGPAIVTESHVQDRILSPVAGAKKGYRRMDGLDILKREKVVQEHQLQAGRRLQKDHLESLMIGEARSGGTKVNGRKSYDIPDRAIEARDRVKAALAVLPPELVSLTVLALLPDFETEPCNFERIGKRIRENKRAISFGLRMALSLIARHYGH